MQFFSASLIYPVFEIGGKEISADLFKFEKTNERQLINGGSETIYKGTKDDISISVYLQKFQSPFIRYKYIVSSENDTFLTKKNGKDNILYTGFKTDRKNSRLTELQFSQFDPTVHSYVPYMEEKKGDDCDFSGPVAIIETENVTKLLGYEHGAQIPDTYLKFYAEADIISVKALKGNYYNGENIKKRPFVSPWFHFAVCEGNKTEMFKYYREFLLKYICENPVSRTPYIFYNTWNYQERNYLVNGKTYRDSMNLERILAEIEIAHKMEIDVYVLDTGWFEKTGDYNVSKERFPDELKQVKKKLSEYNMKLGLWFNPIVAAVTSEVCTKKPEYRLMQDGHTVKNQVWESEESYWMCLASDYSDYFIKKMIKFRKEYGVTYFKWDGIGQYGCYCEYHNHGTIENSVSERHECYSFRMGMEMIRVVGEVTKKCPDIIVDFDVTESGRFVGLGFLSVGKYFLINNGPYAMDFDLPEKYEMKREGTLAVNLNGYANLFFFPGAARSRFCRQFIKYDFFVPSVLFLVHFLPDTPLLSQKNAVASMLLGGNGIWGDLLALTDDDISFYKNILKNYKEVAQAITNSYPKTKGFIGSSPEIYEKIDNNKGMICFFTKYAGTYTHITGEMDLTKMPTVTGAKGIKVINGNKLEIEVELLEDDAAIVFITG